MKNKGIWVIIAVVAALAIAAVAWFIATRGPKVNPNARPGELRWMLKVGMTVSSYIECDGRRVYCTGPSIWGLGKPRLFAYDAANGKRLWTRPIWRGSPCLMEGVGIFTAKSRSNRIKVLDERTGNVKWGFDSPYGVYEAQRLDGNTICMCAGQGLAAIDAKTGVPKWVLPDDDSEGFYPPSIPGDGHIYVYAPTDAGTVRAIDARTGKEAWETDTGEWVRDITAGAGAVYLHHGDNVLHALDAKTGQEKWAYNAVTRFEHGIFVGDGRVYAKTRNAVVCLRPEDGTEVWAFPAKRMSWMTGFAARGGILYCGIDNSLCALDAATGAPKWRFQVKGDVIGAPVISGDTAYFETLVMYTKHLYRGYLYAVVAEPEGQNAGP